jgi:hypothetical protein
VCHFGCLAFSRDMHSRLREFRLLRARCILRFVTRSSLGRRVNVSVHPPTDDLAHISLRISLLSPLSSRARGLYQRALDTSMHNPRNCGVLMAAPRRPRAVRRRQMWLSLATIIFRLFFIAVVFCCDVLRIRPVVLFTPSLVAELFFRVPRRLFCRNKIILLLTSFSFRSNIFARRSPLEPSPCSPSTETPSAFPPDAVSFSARRPFSTGGSAFHHFLRRQRAVKPWGGIFRFSPARARCAHFSLSFLSILPPRYLSSRIVHLIYEPICPLVLACPYTMCNSMT